MNKYSAVITRKNNAAGEVGEAGGEGVGNAGLHDNSPVLFFKGWLLGISL